MTQTSLGRDDVDRIMSAITVLDFLASIVFSRKNTDYSGIYRVNNMGSKELTISGEYLASTLRALYDSAAGTLEEFNVEYVFRKQ